MKRIIAVLLAASITALAPGLEAYRVFAQPVPVDVPVVVNGDAAVGGIANGFNGGNFGGAGNGAAVNSGGLLNRGGAGSNFNGRKFQQGEPATRLGGPATAFGGAHSTANNGEGDSITTTPNDTLSPVPSLVNERGETGDSVVETLKAETTRIVAEQKEAKPNVTPEAAQSGGAHDFERVVYKRLLSRGPAVFVGNRMADEPSSPRAPPDPLTRGNLVPSPQRGEGPRSSRPVLPPLGAYKQPLAVTVRLNAARAAHYGFYAAGLASFGAWLGVYGFAAPLLLIGAFGWMYKLKRAQEEAARRTDSNSGVMIQVGAQAERLDGMLKRWSRAYKMGASLLTRLGMDPERDMPQLKIETANPEDPDLDDDPQSASSAGNDIKSGSYLGVGKDLALWPVTELASVLSHELGHLFFQDSRITRTLRGDGGRVILAGFFKYSTVTGTALAAMISALGNPVFAVLCAVPLIASIALIRNALRDAGSASDRKWLVLWSPSILVAHLGSPYLLLAVAFFTVAGWVAGNAVTRAKELRADQFAAWLTHPKWLADYMERVMLPANEAPKDLVTQAIHWTTRSHPTVESRIAAMRKAEAKAGAAPDAELLGNLWDDPFVAGVPSPGDPSRNGPNGGGNGMAERFSVLYANPKSGHAKAAQAIADQITKTDSNATVAHVRWDNAINPTVTKAGSTLYGWILKKAPFLWELVYDNPTVDKVTKVPVDLFLTASGKSVNEALKATKPEAAIATQALMSASMSAAMAATGESFPLFGVLTDFTLNSFWIRDEVTHYFVAADEVKEEMVRRGVAAGKVTVSGIPIHPKFSAPLTRDEARSKLGLDPAKPVLLLSGGNHGLGGFADTLRELKVLDTPAQLVVITGGNKELYAELKAEFGGDPSIRIEGYVDNMEVWMKAADLMLGKPGGLTTAEALAVGLPLVIMDPLPGQESRNTEYLTSNGAAVQLARGSLVPRLSELMGDRAALWLLQKNASRLARPDAARVIVEKIQDILR